MTSWETENPRETSSSSEVGLRAVRTLFLPGTLLRHPAERTLLSSEPEAIGGCTGRPGWVKATRPGRPREASVLRIPRGLSSQGPQDSLVPWGVS